MKIVYSFLIILLLITSGCDENNSVVDNGLYGDIDIGVLLPLTGTGSSAGASIEAALQIAAYDVNQYLLANGHNKQVELHFRDTQTDSATALARLEELYVTGIKVIIGPYSSTNLSAIKDYLDRNGILAVSPSSVAISLAIPNDNIFRFVPNDMGQAAAITKRFQQDSIRYIVPVVREDVWGSDLIGAVTDAFTAGGGMVSDVILYGAGVMNVDSLKAKINRQVTEAAKTFSNNQIGVYLISFGEGTYILEAAATDTIYNNVRWYGSSAFAENSQVLTNTTASTFAVTHDFPCPVFGLNDSASANWQPLMAQLETELNRKPESYAFSAYDALFVAVLTYIEEGGYDNIQTYKAEFYNQAELYFGATGNTQLNNAGDRAAATYDFWQITGSGGNYSWIRTAVYNTLTDELHQP